MAVYDLSQEYEIEKAKKNIERLSKKKHTIEIIDKTLEKEEKTWSQIKYVHLLLSIVGLELGFTLNEIKTELKRTVLKDYMVYTKEGKLFTRSFADISKKEMMGVIDKLLIWGPTEGIRLPDSSDTTALQKAKEYVNRNRNYL